MTDVAVADIAAMLRDRAEDVARRYGNPTGAYVAQGQLYMLNPGRPDRRVGSFFVTLTGRYAGRWRDMALSGPDAQGDMLDLIRLALNTDAAGAVREAKAFLGLSGRVDDAALRAARARREAEAQTRARQTDEAAERKRRAARARWFNADPVGDDSPVARYLADRGLPLDQLRFRPRAIRCGAAVPYAHTDGETGKIVETVAPAMLTAITDPAGALVAVHQVWLERVDGRWTKLRCPKPKKILGRYAGACARIWRGVTADGRRGPAFADMPAGSHVVVAEGVETALAVALLRPDLRVVAALSLSNFAGLQLPPACTEVTLCGENDESAAARAAFDRAVAAHRAAGRVVRVHRAEHGSDVADWIKLEGLS